MLKIEFKKLNKTAKLQKAHQIDACYDINAVSYSYNDKFDEYGTGLAVNIPSGYVGLLFPRSSITKKDYSLKNSVGVLDPGFSGEILFRFQRLNDSNKCYNLDDRIGQLMVLKLPEVEFIEVTEFSTKSERGSGGFGSTGN